MINFVNEDILRYADEFSSPEPEIFAQLAEETRSTQKDPQMMVGHGEGLLLRLLVKLARARRILEIGTFTGYSALSMAMALPEGGELITCDVDPVATTLAQKYWAKSAHGKKIRLLLAPASDTIPTLKGPFDLVFIDADKPAYIKYWDAAMPLVRDGGVIIADNVLWSGRVLEPKDDATRAIAAFNAHVAGDARVEHVMLPIRDGITVAVKLT